MTEISKPKREAKRDSLLLTTVLTIAGQRTLPARVRNLSAKGMMVDVTTELAAGTPVTAELRGLGPVDGSVAWAKPGRIGIAFATLIDPQIVRAPPPPASLPVVPRPVLADRRPGLRAR